MFAICGRVRLSSDFSEIKIALRFDLDAPAPNFKPDWNKPPGSSILLAGAFRVPPMLRPGLCKAARIYS
jgi:hypothetical protein